MQLMVQCLHDLRSMLKQLRLKILTKYLSNFYKYYFPL